MPENSANEANYAEIRGHLDIIKAKMSAHVPNSEPHLKLAEDQEDYYERMIQLRIMQNQTQAAELNDALRKVNRYEKSARFLRLGLFAFASTTTIGTLTFCFPQFFQSLLGNTWFQFLCMHGVTASVAVAIALWFKRH